MAKMRMFVASELGAGPTSAVALVGRRLAGVLSAHGWQVRWVGEDKIHLTLKFLGNVAEERVPEIRAAVAPVGAERGPLTMPVRRVGTFPRRGPPRVLWVGLDDPDGEVAHLAADVDARVATLGFPREERIFHPHVTLGRVKRAGSGRIADHVADAGVGEAACGDARLDALTLFRSDLQTGTYHVLGRIPLEGGTRKKKETER